jgi:hypothetical protein
VEDQSTTEKDDTTLVDDYIKSVKASSIAEALQSQFVMRKNRAKTILV